jgi:hypothetical protein
MDWLEDSVVLPEPIQDGTDWLKDSVLLPDAAWPTCWRSQGAQQAENRSDRGLEALDSM